MKATALYAALLAPIYIALAMRVIAVRRSAKVALGDGENPVLTRRIRVHGNFTENVPFALILLGLSEGLGAAAWLVHAIGLVLLLARLSHAWGVSQPREVFAFRIAGMIGTFTAIIAAALACLVLALRGG